MKKAVDVKITGIKCDAPSCDFRDDSVNFENYKQWLNKPCPKCGANLLTQADYDTALLIVWITKICNLPVIRHILNLTGKKKRVKVEFNGTGEVKFIEQPEKETPGDPSKVKVEFRIDKEKHNVSL